jgi:pyruvate carboxylase
LNVSLEGASLLILAVVGPPTEVLRKMGDKVTARSIANTCGIPTIPGTEGPVQSLQDAHAFVKQ